MTEVARQPRRRTPSRLLRWVRRLVVLVVCIALLLLAGLIAIEIVLSSDYPRGLVEQSLRDQTGMHVEVASLSTGWAGETELRDVSLTMPLETQPLLHAPTIRVSHTDLLRLILQQPLELDRMEIEQPTIRIVEDARGQWNLAEAMKLIAATQAAQGSEPAGAGGALPELIMDEATLIIERAAADRSVRFAGVKVRGDDEGASWWGFEVEVPQIAGISGRLSPVATLPHEIELAVRDAHQILKLFPELEVDGEMPIGRAVDLTWRGSAIYAGVRGRLSLREVTVQQRTVRGVFDVTAAGGDLTIDIEAASIDMPESGNPLTLAQGEIALRQGVVHLERIAGMWEGMIANVTGEWNLDTSRGEFDVAWSGQPPHTEITTRGALRIAAANPMTSEASITAAGDVSMNTPYGALETTIDAHVRGESIESARLDIETTRLRWRDEQGVVAADGLRAAIAIDGRTVSLSDLDLPFASVNAVRGAMHLDTHEWSLEIDASAIRPPRFAAADDPAIDLAFSGHGDLEGFNFTRLHMKRGDAVLTAMGTYDPRRATPFTADIAAAAQNLTPAVEGGPAPAAARSKLTASGDLEPMDIAWQGELTVERLPVAETIVEAITVPWNGRITQQAATFETAPFELFEGAWRVSARLDRETTDLVATIAAGAVPLNAILEAVKYPISMEGALEFAAELRVPALDFEATEVDGTWTAVDVVHEGIAVSTAGGRFTHQERMLRLHEIRLEQEEGWIGGSIDIDLEHMDRIHADLNAHEWDIALEDTDARGRVVGSFALDVNLTENRYEGNGAFEVDLFLREQPVGRVSLSAALAEQTLSLSDVSATLLDGRIAGSGTIPLAAPWTSQGGFEWSNLDLAVVADFFPQAAGLAGVSSGSLTIEPATEPHALEPLRLSLHGEIESGSFHGVELGSFVITGYAGPTRIVVQDSIANVGHGRLGIWARASRNAERWSGQLNIDFEGVHLEPIVHALDPAKPATPGILSGSLNMGSVFGEGDRMFGRGDISIRESDLAALPLFTTLYDLMHIDFGSRQPSGAGTARFRLEGSALHVTRMEYFNRGTDIVAAMVMGDVWLGGESPVSGLAIGSVRPFRELDLPLLGNDLDRLVRGLQADAVSVRIQGTLADPSYPPVPLGEVGSSVQRLLNAAFSR